MRDAGAGEIDPAWWRGVVDEESGTMSLSSLSWRLDREAAAAPTGVVREVLSVLAKVTSALLHPVDWNEPFRPMAVLRGRRSSLPSDLNDDEIGVLRRVAGALDGTDLPALRARIYDVCWTYGDRRDSDMLRSAIDSYMDVPLGSETWHEGGREECQRGLELVVRRGADGSAQRERFAEQLIGRLRAASIDEGFFPVQLSSTVRSYRLASKEDRAGLAELAREMADIARAGRDYNLEQAWEGEAAEWYRLTGRPDDSAEAQVRIARSLACEAADRRLAGGGAALAAGTFVERALKVLVLLPRSYRAAHGIEEEIDRLRRELDDDRNMILESMIPIRTGPIDATGLVAHARSQVSGLAPLTALIRLADLHPGASLERARTQAESLAAKHPPSQLFGTEIYNRDGQKVASRPGMSPDSREGRSVDSIDPAIWQAMVRDQHVQMSLVLDAMVLPAIEIVALEHRFPLEWMFEMCRANASIPSGHELSWARGLLHGLNQDFASASAMLVPQLEHLVRVHLKAAGVHTKIVDDLGVETEKGLAALLDDPKIEPILGEDMRFELRSLLTDQAGPNLRNTIAHGLAPDSELLGVAAAYAWWIALKFAVLPFRDTASDLDSSDPGRDG